MNKVLPFHIGAARAEDAHSLPNARLMTTRHFYPTTTPVSLFGRHRNNVGARFDLVCVGFFCLFAKWVVGRWWTLQAVVGLCLRRVAVSSFLYLLVRAETHGC